MEHAARISMYDVYLSELKELRDAIAKLSEYPVATRALLGLYEDLVAMSEDFVHSDLSPLGIKSRYDAIVEVNKMRNKGDE